MFQDTSNRIFIPPFAANKCSPTATFAVSPNLMWTIWTAVLHPRSQTVTTSLS